MAEKMRQRPPPSSSPCAPSPPTISHRLGRHSVGCCVPSFTGSHRKSRPRCSLYFYFFVALIDPPKRRVHVLPHALRPAVSPLQRPPHRRHHHSVDCCVNPTSGGHQKLVLRSIFRWAPFRPSKRGYQTRLTGSRGIAIRVHGRCRHGEGGGSPLGNNFATISMSTLFL
jgi:hypothetical protein